MSAAVLSRTDAASLEVCRDRLVELCGVTPVPSVRTGSAREELSRASALVTAVSGCEVVVHRPFELPFDVRAELGRLGSSSPTLPEDVVLFDGAVFNIAVCDAAVSNTIHELGHWLVAPQLWRRFANFGLGGAFDEHPATEPSRVRPAAARREEEPVASAVGVLLEWVYGFDWAFTAVEHCWVDDWCGTHAATVEDAEVPPLTCSGCWSRLHRFIFDGVEMIEPLV